MFDILAQLAASTASTLFGRVGEAPSHLLDQPLRRRLLGLIEQQPGIHASELARASGEPWGTVQYHLSLLHKGQAVTSIEAGRERLFFPHEVDPARARLLALLGQGRRPEIVAFIRDHPGARQIDICDAVDVSRKTFRSSIEPLVHEGLVHERKGLQSNRYFPQPPLQDLMEPAVAPSPPAAVPGLLA